MSKYAPLNRHLAGTSTDRIRLSFAEIERILGFSLPASARTYAPWWANVGGSHVQARAWMDAGWQTLQVDVPGEAVSFVRESKPPRSTLQERGSSFLDGEIRIDTRRLSADAAQSLSAYLDEADGDLAAAIDRALRDASETRRRRMIERFATAAPTVSGDSTQLIREDRDGR